MTRREILFAPLSASLLSSQQPVGAAFIGVGNRGAHLMRQVLDIPGVKVVALCDIKPDRLDRAASAAARDNPKTYASWRELLDDPTVQAVHIATPCDLHVEMAIAALRAGKHVYCEKPAGITPASIAELVKAVNATDKVFVIGQQLRSSRKLQAVIKRIHEGICGKVVMIKAQRHASDDLPHDGPSADWFFDARRSGDVIVEMAVHNLDACNWIAQSRPALAAGFGGALVWADDPPGRTNMDGYCLSYEYANGVKLSFTQVFFHARGMAGNGQYFYVYGTEGSVDVDAAMFYPRARDAQPVSLYDAAASPREPLDKNHLTAFFDAITRNAPNPAGVLVGATGALTAILGREAIYRKRMMSWDDLGVSL
jgi:predicted dehydrogenase